jgi:hypothetical protein
MYIADMGQSARIVTCSRVFVGISVSSLWHSGYDGRLREVFSAMVTPNKDLPAMAGWSRLSPSPLEIVPVMATVAWHSQLETTLLS